jgi:hypothetical protein
MAHTPDALFSRRVRADRQRLDDNRGPFDGAGTRPAGGPAMTAAPQPVSRSHAGSMKSARAELATRARSVDQLHDTLHPYAV